jgi:hypothetical protein
MTPYHNWNIYNAWHNKKHSNSVTTLQDATFQTGSTHADVSW